MTGIGMVTPLGIGKEEFGRRLFSGETAIAEIKSFDTSSFPSHLGAEVTNFNPRDFISVKNMRRMDKISLMTAASARMALEDAGMQITTRKPRPCRHYSGHRFRRDGCNRPVRGHTAY